MEQGTQICRYFGCRFKHISRTQPSAERFQLMLRRYVINSEAMKKLYKTMKRPSNTLDEPRDLSREWHSDSKLPFSPLQIQEFLMRQVATRLAHRISVSYVCKIHRHPAAIPFGAQATNCMFPSSTQTLATYSHVPPCSSS